MGMRLEGRDAIEAYLTESGMIALKQENPMEDPSIILMTPHDVPHVVNWLQQLAAEQEELEIQAAMDEAK